MIVKSTNPMPIEAETKILIIDWAHARR